MPSMHRGTSRTKGLALKQASAGLRKSPPCGPPSVTANDSATAGTREAAVREAASNARADAGALCHGDCSQGENCTYVETSTNVSVKENPPSVGGQPTYTAQATTTGGCQCT